MLSYATSTKGGVETNTTKHTLKLDADEVLPEDLADLVGGVSQALADGVMRSLQLGQTALTGRAGCPLGPPPRVGAQAHATGRDPHVYTKLEHHGKINLSVEPRNPRGVNALGLALHRSPGVLFADLTDCAIGDAGAKALSVALCSANAPPLREVRLGGNMLSDAGAHSLASALRRHTQLTTLQLERNVIGPEGAAALAAALPLSASLRRLDLAHNRAAARGVAALAEVLPYCARLETLRLEHNGAAQGGTQQAQRALVAALRAELPALRQLALHANGFGESSREALRGAHHDGPNRARLMLTLAPPTAADAADEALLQQLRSFAEQHAAAALEGQPETAERVRAKLAVGRHSAEVSVPAGCALAEMCQAGECDPARAADVLLRAHDSNQPEKAAATLLAARRVVEPKRLSLNLGCVF